MYRFLVINGPNLNMLGIREKDQYGEDTLEDINKKIFKYAANKNIELDFFQSNHEGLIVDKINEAYNKFDCIIINAAAYTHYSYAIRDAIKAHDSLVIEVHLTNIYQREEFRHKSVISAVCKGTITGFGYYGYILAIEAGINNLKT